MAAEDAAPYAMLPEERLEVEERRKARVYYWTMASLNFFETGSGAGLTKFLPLFLAARGLNAAQVGLVLGLMQAGKFGGGLAFGRAADRTGRYKAILLWTNVCSIGLALAMTSRLAPWKPYGGTPWLRVAIIAALSNAQAFFASSSGTLIDAIAVVNQSSGSADYGSLRLWAAFGWGVLALCIGAAVDAVGYSAIFAAYAAGTGGACVVVVAAFENPVRGSVAPSPEDGDLDDDLSSQTSRKPTSLRAAFLGNPVVPLYFVNFFLHGCLAAFVESFLLLYVASRYPTAPSWFLGLLVLEAALCEMPVFLYASRALDRFGVRPLLVFAQLLYAARCLAYAYLPAVAGEANDRGYYLFLLLEPSHALTFALMWSAAVEYGRLNAPQQHQGAAQALLRGVYYYVGVGVGSFVGGKLVKAYGFQVLFKVGALAMLAWSALWAILLKLAAPYDTRATTEDALVDPPLLMRSNDSTEFI